MVNKKLWYTALGVIFVALASVPSIYFYLQYRGAQERLQNPSEAAKEDNKKLIGDISKLMILPTDEDPTIAVVSDVSKLTNQPFFANAKNGDKVLIYTKARKAILYRPDANKIIEVGPVNIGTPSAQLSPTPSATEQMTLVLRNGTSTIGATQKVEDRLKTTVTNLAVTDRQNAANKDYTTTIVVDVRGDKGTTAQQIATAIGAAVGPLPSDEQAPNADFLIIVGADKK